MKKLIQMLLFCTSFQMISCKIGDLPSAIDQTREAIVPRLDNATSAIQNAPQQWESVMMNLKEDLFKNDFVDIANRVDVSIGKLNVQWTSGVLCIVESVPKQALLTIKNLRSELLGLPLTRAEIGICNTSISDIDLNVSVANRTTILCAAYNLDPTALEVFLRKKANNNILKLNNIIELGGDNKLVLNISNIKDVTFADYDVLVLRDKNTGKDYSFPIIPKRPAPVITTIASLAPTGSFFSFQHIRGDKEFNAGPRIKLAFRLKISPNRRQLLYDIYFEAAEQGGDKTTLAGYITDQVGYTLANDKKILNIVGNEYYYYKEIANFLDMNGTRDNDGLQTAIATFDLIGDTNGLDVGKTGIKRIVFNKTFTIEIQ
jgi:hypothetical protein